MSQKFSHSVNSATPLQADGYILSDRPLSDDDLRRVREDWARRYTGASIPDDCRFDLFSGNADLTTAQVVKDDDDDWKPVTGLTQTIVMGVVLTTWIAGIVLAKGWVSTLIATIFPFWAWYLFVERLLESIGWL